MPFLHTTQHQEPSNTKESKPTQNHTPKPKHHEATKEAKSANQQNQKLQRVKPNRKHPNLQKLAFF